MKQTKENMEMLYGKHPTAATVNLAGTQITPTFRTLAVRSSCAGAVTAAALMQVRSFSTTPTVAATTTIRSV